jgi:cytidylate kinase
VNELLHLFSKGGRVVMDGRDIGTSVFPNAELKIFLTASPKVRVKRRYDELISKGQKTSYEEVVKNLSERDYIDSHRSVSPLRKAEDAFVLDNSDMTLHEEIIWLRGLIQGRFGLFE